MTDLKCKNGVQAAGALSAIAEALPSGVQKKSLNAVIAWARENAGPETGIGEQKLQEIFCAETEGEKKAREWFGRGSRRREGGAFFWTEPADGAECRCVWNAETKRWEPTFPPPLVSFPPGRGPGLPDSAWKMNDWL